MPPANAATLIAMLEFRAQTTPNRSAFHWQGQPHRFDDLWERVNQFAAFLIEQGIERGDRIALLMPNSAAFFDAFYGIQRAGAIAVPLFPSSGVERIIGTMRGCGARLVVVPEADLPDWRAKFANIADTETPITPISAAAGIQPTIHYPEIAPDDIAYLQYTSGSTGTPKGVILTHHNLMTNIQQLITGMQITDADVFVSWLPVYHDMGLILKTMVPFYLAADLHLLPTSLANISLWLDTIQQQGGTLTAAPDFAYRLCLRFIKDPANYNLKSLRVALNAAEPVRITTMRDFEAAFGLHHVMIAGYGLAEATVGVATWTPRTAPYVDDRGLVSVGRPFAGIDVRIVTQELLEPSNQVGEIMVKSPANAQGYFEDPDNTGTLFWNDGYIRTGDLGYLDDEGHLFIAGRRKNIIKQGGETIFPQEVETVVESIGEIRRAAAVGIDRGGREGEQLFVFAELRKADVFSDDNYYELSIAVVQMISEHIGLRPARVYLVKPHAIPQTHNGKTQYESLREMYLNGSLRAEGHILYPAY